VLSFRAKTRLERVVIDKHSSLFGGSISDREKVLTPAKLQNFSSSLLMNGQKARLFASGIPLQARIMFQVTPELTSLKISWSVWSKFSPARLIFANIG
jgi:hypothetical protein